MSNKWRAQLQEQKYGPQGKGNPTTDNAMNQGSKEKPELRNLIHYQ